MHGVIGGVMTVAQVFKRHSACRTSAWMRLERVGEHHPFVGMAFAGTGRVLLLAEPRQVLCRLQPRFQFPVFTGESRLFGEARELVAEFDADILTRARFSRVSRQPAFGFLAPLLVLGDARRFLEKHTQFLGLASITREIMPCSMMA